MNDEELLAYATNGQLRDWFPCSEDKRETIH
jgi:hypothetical protein